MPPTAAITRKTNPVTSSQSWCKTLPKERAVARAAPVSARTVRLRPACCQATRVTIPIFRAVETLITASILTVSGVTMAQRRRIANRFPAQCIQLLCSRREEFCGLGPSYNRKVLNVGSVTCGRRGSYVDQQLKQLMKELGEAVNESLSESQQISEVVSRIKDGGYDIFLVLEAT